MVGSDVNDATSKHNIKLTIPYVPLCTSKTSSSSQGKGDSAYNSLEYVPCCPHMPNCVPVCTEPVFHWVKKGHAAAQIPK